MVAVNTTECKTKLLRLINMKKIGRIFLALILMLAIVSYGGKSFAQTSSSSTTTAIAEIKSTEDSNQTIGAVKFTPTDSGLEIAANIKDISEGKHGFHIHETGSCADGGNASGGHFNPDNVKHGYLPEDGFKKAQAGDLGNITINETGTGYVKLNVAGLTLEEGKYAVANLAVIVHELEDDFGQPAGNAGGRIGCGIIELQ